MNRKFDLTPVQLLFFVFLIILGLAGNYFNIQLIFGVNFLFGGIAVLLVLWYFGFWYGIIAAFIVYSYTFILWGHPFGWILFVIETAVLGVSLRRYGYKGLLLTDLIFWLLIGMPYAWITNHFVLRLDNHYTLFIALKQTFNGLFNVIIATVIVLTQILPERFTKRPIKVRFSTFNIVTSLSAGIVFIAILTYTILDSNLMKKNIDKDLHHDFVTQANDLQERLSTWYDTHEFAVQQLAEQAEHHWNKTTLVQEYTQTICQLFPHFHNMYVADSTATTITFSPLVNEKGESTLGLHFGDRNYFKKVKKAHSTILSDVFQGRGGIFEPIVIMASPVLYDSTFLGYATGALNLSYLRKLISEIARDHQMHVLIVDQGKRIVAASDIQFRPLKRFSWSETKKFVPTETGFFIAEPKQNNLSIMQNWDISQYYYETPISAKIPWKLVLFLPVSRFQQLIYQGYITNFSLGLGFFVLLLLLTMLSAKWLTSPMEQLRDIARSLPQYIKSQKFENIDWPNPRSIEQDALIQQLQFTYQQLNKNFQKINEQTKHLKQEIIKRTTAQDKLQESEARFRNVVETIGEGLLITDFDDKIIYANSTICTMTQYRRDELEGNFGYKLLLPEKYWPMLRERHKQRQQEVSEVYEVPINRKDGTIFHCRIHAVPFYNSKGELSGTLGVLTDISELKAAQDRLTRKNTALNVLTTSNEVLVRHEDLAEIYEKICWAITEYGHYNLTWIGEITRSGDDEILKPVAQWGDSESWILDREFPLSTGNQGAKQHPVVRALDEKKSMLVNKVIPSDIPSVFREEVERYNLQSCLVLPLYLGENVYGVLTIYSSEPDQLTETEQAVYSTLAEDLSFGIQAIKRNQERMQVLDQLELQDKALNATSNAIVLTDRDGIILWVNPAFTKMTGYTADEAIGETPAITRSGKYDPSYYKNMWETIRSGESWQSELVNKRKDGSLFTEWQTITPVKNDAGEITHFIAIKQDVSEYKKLEQQLIQSQKIESLGEIAGGIAHDFNNVLAVIEGAREMLSVVLDKSSKGSKYLPMIESSVERGRDITSRMLTFTRTDEPHFQTVSIMQVIADVQNIVEHTLPKNIKLIIDEYREMDLIRGDQNQIQQVLINLCINATDAMPDGGEIYFNLEHIPADEIDTGSRSGSGFLKIQVRDTGEGIPPDIQKTIFKPFFTTKPQGKGTGLGLSIVQRIIDNHHGEITCDSILGEGTTFTIYLPLVSEKAAPPNKDTFDTLPQSNGERILIVDDEEYIQMLLGEILTRKGYSVSTATTGKEALAMVDEYIQLVITDLGLPDISGKKLVEKLRSKFPKLKMMTITGYINDADSDQLEELGVVQIVQKPFDVEDLLKNIALVLSNHSIKSN